MVVNRMKPKSRKGMIIDLKNIDGIWQIDHGYPKRTDFIYKKNDLSEADKEEGCKSCFQAVNFKKKFGGLQRQEYPS